MTGKQRMIQAFKREPISGHAPHFELVYFLTMEKFGKVHPSHRAFSQWKQMSKKEQQAQIDDVADCFIQIAETYHHDAIFIHNPWDIDVKYILESIRKKSGDQYLLMIHGDTTFGVPSGDDMVEFSVKMYEEPEELHDIAKRGVENAVRNAEILKKHGCLDCFALCSDYAFNVNPFFTPDQFAEFVAPYLKQTIDEYRKLGFWTIKHTDGNINPILDQIVNAGPDALHSIDPQGYMNLADVRAKYSDRICTIGNVNCGLLQTGTQEEADADVRRCLHEGMDDGKNGFVFSTSNCVYTGLDLARYERMVEIWQNEGIYEKRPALAK